ncbi:hypothetical protein [Paenibacillus sp. YIM B09110]|uniref:hypothetical protein n=1 Tax=Paenibacillus sp. YIM B09110 TaxID=3126102 RepID=UPI00301C1DAB
MKGYWIAMILTAVWFIALLHYLPGNEKYISEARFPWTFAYIDALTFIPPMVLLVVADVLHRRKQKQNHVGSSENRD